MKKIILLILMIIIASAIFPFLLRWFDSEKQLPELTNDLALKLVSDKLIEGECIIDGVDELYRSCVINLEESSEENIWLITIIYEGFFDDSVRGSRLRIKTTLENQAWKIVGEPIEDFQCWLGRGHEDFSTEYCI